MKYKDFIVYGLVTEFLFFMLSMVFNADIFYITYFILNVLVMTLAIISLVIKEK